MSTAIEIKQYFEAEKAEGMLGTAIGLVSIVLGSYFLAFGTEFQKGVGYIFIAFALIEVMVFLTVAIRAPKDVARVQTWLTSDTFKIKTDEIPRMRKVMDNFLYYRWAEIILLIVGIIIFVTFQQQLLSGIGVSLIIHSTLLLILDAFAEKRGRGYIKYLENALS